MAEVAIDAIPLAPIFWCFQDRKETISGICYVQRQESTMYTFLALFDPVWACHPATMCATFKPYFCAKCVGNGHAHCSSSACDVHSDAHRLCDREKMNAASGSR
eukprot:s554_g21.t1